MVAKTSAFEDKGDIAAWAMDSAGYCISTGLFIGDHQNRLNPKANITYFECAIVFLRLIGYTQETLAVQAGETVEQWRLRVTKLADSRGLFNGVLFYANDRYDQKICRQDVAVMCANALNGHTVTFYPVQDEAVYVETRRRWRNSPLANCKIKRRSSSGSRRAAIGSPMETAFQRRTMANRRPTVWAAGSPTPRRTTIRPFRGTVPLQKVNRP